jgi:mannosyltransferase
LNLSGRGAAQWSLGARLGAAAVLLLAACLRLWHLGTEPVWCDEAYFWVCATHPGWLPTLLHTMADDVYPPLFFLLLHFLHYFTSSIFFLRLPGALAGVASVAVLMRLLGRFASKRAALSAGLLAALSPVLIYYCQELKMYSILALWLLLLLEECLRCLEEPQRPAWRVTLWALLAYYTFYLSVIACGCLALLALWLKRAEPGPWKQLWRAFAWAALGCLPWLPFFVKSVLVNQGSVFNFHMGRIVLYSLENFSVGFWPSAGFRALAALAFALLVAHSLFKMDAEKERPQDSFLLLLAGFCFLPLLLSWGVSLAAKPMYSDRAMLASGLGWLGLAGLGLSRLKPRASWLGLGCLAALELAAYQPYAMNLALARPDYKPAWNYVLEHWQSGDSLFHQHIISYYPFKFYALEEAADPGQSPYHDEPGAALSDSSARVPGLRPNWVVAEAPPAFTSNEGAGRIRGLWREANAWLGAHGLGIYTGYNRDMVFPPRLQQEALPGVKRIWYIQTQPQGYARMWLPQINVFETGYSDWRPFEPKKLSWLDKGFRPAGLTVVAEVEVHLFEKAK